MTPSKAKTPRFSNAQSWTGTITSWKWARGATWYINIFIVFVKITYQIDPPQKKDALCATSQDPKPLEKPLLNPAPRSERPALRVPNKQWLNSSDGQSVFTCFAAVEAWKCSEHDFEEEPTVHFQDLWTLYHRKTLRIMISRLPLEESMSKKSILCWSFKYETPQNLDVFRTLARLGGKSVRGKKMTRSREHPVKEPCASSRFCPPLSCDRLSNTERV